jgi:hypothetical protein
MMDHKASSNVGVGGSKESASSNYNKQKLVIVDVPPPKDKKAGCC